MLVGRKEAKDLVEGRTLIQAWLKSVWEDSWKLRSACLQTCAQFGLTMEGLAAEDGQGVRRIPYLRNIF